MHVKYKPELKEPAQTSQAGSTVKKFYQHNLNKLGKKKKSTIQDEGGVFLN